MFLSVFQSCIIYETFHRWPLHSPNSRERDRVRFAGKYIGAMLLQSCCSIRCDRDISWNSIWYLGIQPESSSPEYPSKSGSDCILCLSRTEGVESVENFLTLPHHSPSFLLLFYITFLLLNLVVGGQLKKRGSVQRGRTSFVAFHPLHACSEGTCCSHVTYSLAIIVPWILYYFSFRTTLELVLMFIWSRFNGQWRVGNPYPCTFSFFGLCVACVCELGVSVPRFDSEDGVILFGKST